MEKAPKENKSEITTENLNKWSRVKSHLRRFWLIYLVPLLTALINLGDIIDHSKDFYYWLCPPAYEKCDKDGNIHGEFMQVEKAKIGSTLKFQSGYSSNPTIFEAPASSKPFCPFIWQKSEEAENSICFFEYKINKKGHLLITMDLRDETGCIVGKIKENKVVLNVGCMFSYNYDNYGLEVIDSYDEVVFSLDLKKPDTLIFRGIFYNPNYVTIFGDEVEMKFKPRGLQAIKSAKSKLAKLFEYTGKDYRGKRNPDFPYK